MRALGLVTMLVIGCGDDTGTVGCPTSVSTAADEMQCVTTPGCQLMEPYCPPQQPPLCPDGPGQPSCRATEAPTESSGAACDSLDEAACRHRDDCKLVRNIATSALTCAVE